MLFWHGLMPYVCIMKIQWMLNLLFVICGLLLTGVQWTKQTIFELTMRKSHSYAHSGSLFE